MDEQQTPTPDEQADAAANEPAPSSPSPPPSDAKSADSQAALAAAMAAIQQAKTQNPAAMAAAAAAAAEASASAAPSNSSAATQPAPVSLPSFSAAGDARLPEGIDLLADVNLQVKIELGRTRMVVEDVLRLGEGSVVELDKLAGDPVDVYVNDRHVARGEVLVLNDNFCVRINEIVAQTGEEAA